MESIASLLPLILIFVLFWFILIRPQRNRQRQMMQMQRELTVGQQVVTTSGLYGTVVGLDEDSVTLETSPGVTSRWARAAVGRIVPSTPPTSDAPES